MLNLYQIGALIFLYKKTPVGSINDIAEVVEKSAVVNHAQLVGEHDGTIHVSMYNWSKFFEGLTIQIALPYDGRKS